LDILPLRKKDRNSKTSTVNIKKCYSENYINYIKKINQKATEINGRKRADFYIAELHRSECLGENFEGEKPSSEIYEQDEMKIVLPSLRMTKIYDDFYGSAVFRATKFFLMTKLEFGKQ